VSTVIITDFDTSQRVEHVVFGDELVALSDAAIHALSINAQLLAIADRAHAGRIASQPPTPV
jgi:hypothetical protein